MGQASVLQLWRRFRAGAEWAWLSHTESARHPTSSVSLCTSIRNRFEHLEATFLKNIEDNLSHPDVEHVLLNYNCPDPRTEEWAREKLPPYIESGRVTYLFFPEAMSFQHSHARNLSIHHARGQIVCNVDGDNFTGKDFACYLSAKLRKTGVFLRGGGLGMPGFGGRIAVRKDDWQAVGGYDEHFTGWGGEDMDFCDRLIRLGLKRKQIALKRFAAVIDHEDEMRNSETSVCTKRESQVANHELRMKNNREGVIQPQGDKFGLGRVQVNFGEWIDV